MSPAGNKVDCQTAPGGRGWLLCFLASFFCPYVFHVILLLASRDDLRTWPNRLFDLSLCFFEFFNSANMLRLQREKSV